MTTAFRLIALLFGFAGPLAAQAHPPGFVMPREVVLYVQSDLPDSGFVDPLVCALERVLTVPITVKTSNFPIGPNLILRGRQYDVEAIASHFSSDMRVGEPAFRHLIVSQDVNARGYNFLFASRYGDGPVPERIQVASTARLRDGLTGKSKSQSADALAARLYKIILRGVIHGAGYGGQGCVLASTNSYLEFNTKMLDLCPDDRANLVAVGLVRETERAECAPAISWNSRRAGAAPPA